MKSFIIFDLQREDIFKNIMDENFLKMMNDMNFQNEKTVDSPEK